MIPQKIKVFKKLEIRLWENRENKRALGKKSIKVAKIIGNILFFTKILRKASFPKSVVVDLLGLFNVLLF